MSGRKTTLGMILSSVLLLAPLGTLGPADARTGRGSNAKNSASRKVAQNISDRPAGVATTVTTITAPTLTNSANLPASTGEEPEVVDSALLSVLKDLSKAAAAGEELKNLPQAEQRNAARLGLLALDLAVSQARTAANRIMSGENKSRFEKGLTPESWESGALQLPNKAHASLNVLWGKKINGIINVTIAGDCNCQGETGGAGVSDFVMVITGKSSLDGGFDIQSQTNVDFWLGKLTGAYVDATTCLDHQAKAQSSSPVLKALTTKDLLKRKEAIAQYNRVVSQQRANTAPAPLPQPTNALTLAPAPEPGARVAEASTTAPPPELKPPIALPTPTPPPPPTEPQNLD